MNLKNSKNKQKKEKSDSLKDVEIKIGSIVSIVDLGTEEVMHFKLVSSAQPGMQLDEVSAWSPIGTAILGRRIGESFSVETPKENARYQILKIKEEE